MGKAARRRNDKRQAYLSELARNNPERFEFEWERRLSSWLSEIRLSLRDEALQGPSAFKIVDHAILVLSGCGEAVIEKYGKKTRDLLENTCCRELAGYFDTRLYQMNYRFKTKD